MTPQITLQRMTDGGRDIPPGAFATIADEEDPDTSKVLVVQRPDPSETTAGTYSVPGTGKTVAEYNGCDEREPIVGVVFVETLNKRLTHWTPEEVLTTVEEGGIFEEGIRIYAFPRSGLRPVDVGNTECERRHERPVRSEPADFGGGESTGVQDL